MTINTIVSDNWMTKQFPRSYLRFKGEGIVVKDLINIALKSNDVHKLLNAITAICLLLNERNIIKYSLYAAELALPFFGKKYQIDSRPRDAIDSVQCNLSRDIAISKARLAINAAFEVDEGEAYYAAIAAYQTACAYASVYIEKWCGAAICRDVIRSAVDAMCYSNCISEGKYNEWGYKRGKCSYYEAKLNDICYFGCDNRIKAFAHMLNYGVELLTNNNEK